MSVLSLIALAAVVVVEEDSPRPEKPVSVPRAAAVVIDGTLDEAEWRGSAVVKRAEGEVLLRHDGKYLYVGVRTLRRGFPSVCLVRGNTVRVIHASVALGEAVYERKDGVWRLDSPFAWESQGSVAGEAQDSQRARFLAERAWLGSMVPMGNPRHAEMQIALDQLDARDPRLSVAFLLEGEGPGYAPERVRFRKGAWTRLRLGAGRGA